MNKRITILNELKEISPLLASIGCQLPYTVPAGYFEGLAESILLRINTENTENGALDRLSKAPVYEVPAGYFEGLAATVLNRVKASAAATPKEELSFLSPLLGGLEKKSPFTTPAGYFNELPENVVSGVQAIEFVNKELENLSPLMVSLRTKNVYQVPAGYFERLPGEILNKVQRQPAKVISISFRKRVIRYAAAAVVTGLIAAGSWIFFNRSGKNGQDPVDTGIAKMAGQIPDQELESFLTDNTIALADAGTITNNGSISETDSKDLFANVSDDELQKYLEEHGDTKAVIN